MHLDRFRGHDTLAVKARDFADDPHAHAFKAFLTVDRRDGFDDAMNVGLYIVP